MQFPAEAVAEVVERIADGGLRVSGAGVNGAPVLVVALNEGGGDGEAVLRLREVVEEGEE